MRRTLKTIVAALLLGSASVALASQAHAAPPTPPSQHEFDWMDRASKNYDGGGN